MSANDTQRKLKAQGRNWSYSGDALNQPGDDFGKDPAKKTKDSTGCRLGGLVSADVALGGYFQAILLDSGRTTRPRQLKGWENPSAQMSLTSPDVTLPHH